MLYLQHNLKSVLGLWWILYHMRVAYLSINSGLPHLLIRPELNLVLATRICFL